ncbi:hypothetical protein Taro_043085, partial [Colocasia esculenta]|nr:hypothetical protein [Colocasia esculenta]
LDLQSTSRSSAATYRQPTQSCRQAHSIQNPDNWDYVYLSTGPWLLSTDTHSPANLSSVTKMGEKYKMGCVQSGH